jgi:hydroxyethylthiazole kinase-like sugar kinase family protein
MGILDKLHTIIDQDVAKVFAATKKASVIAGNEVEVAHAALVAAHQKAVDLAQQTQAHAEAAAAEARKAADELAIEAKAALEKLKFHQAQLDAIAPPKLEPTL